MTHTTPAPASPQSAPSPFSPALPHFQTAWDSTSLGALKDCPRKYKLSILDKWSPKSKSHHLTFGGLYASGVERYAHLLASGLPHDAAVLGVVRWVLEASGSRPHVTVETEAGGKVVQSVCTKCSRVNSVKGERELELDGGRCPKGDFVAWDSKDTVKNRYTLVRTLVWNFEDRQHSPFKQLILANGKPAVELSFNFPAFEVEGETVSLCGHMDSIIELDGKPWVLDDKTTGSQLNANYFSRYTPENQMSLYSIAGKVVLDRPVAGVLVRAAQIGVNFARFATAQVPRPPAILAEWMEDTRAWVTLAKRFAEANHWPGNDKHCTMCDFRRVCAVSPSHRAAWLKEDFEPRVWNPLIPRGE